jgi:two-component system, cell cycle sensor histidine kinase and response regulator CckA
VLTNLVVNAAQAMPSGGKIHVGTAMVTLSESDAGTDRAGTYVKLFVEDTGPGVPVALRTRIFEPFFSTKPANQGSGLGLSVVQGIVEQHQGHIVLCDGTLGGARFEVYPPVTAPAADSAEEAPPSSRNPASLELRVLLVEDQKMVRELTQRLLAGAGFKVVSAESAEEALALAQASGFDVLLTDVVLPHMSGPDLAAHLRSHGLSFRTVYISGYPADFVELRVQLGPEDALVSKPFTRTALVRAVRHQGG